MSVPKIEDFVVWPHPQSQAKAALDPHREGKRVMGEALMKALLRSGITKQEAAYTLGYSDPGVLSRWTLGTEAMQVGKLIALGPEFRRQWLIAQAEAFGMSVRTSIRAIDGGDAAGLGISTEVLL